MDEKNNMWSPNNGVRYSNTKLQPQQFWRRYLWQIATAISLLLVIIFASTTVYFATRSYESTTHRLVSPNPTQAATSQPVAVNTPTPTSFSQTPTVGITPTPSPPVAKVGSALCSADASTQWNGWTGTADWKIFNNMLINDGSNGSYQTEPTIVAPCQLDNYADYAVEMRMQIVRGNNCVDMNIRGTASGNDWQGYKAHIGCNGEVSLSAKDNDTLTKASFDPTTAWHVYRLEVKGASIRLLVDGGLLLNTSDNRYLTGSQVGIKSFSTQINISSYKVFVV